MEYWTVNSKIAERNGYTCRECKGQIPKGTRLMYRDGRRIRLMYHEGCFSGSSDPRSQFRSSFNQKRMPPSCFSNSAPKSKY